MSATTFTPRRAFLVLPGFAVAYRWAGPPRLGKRLWQSAVAGLGIIAGAGWWVLAAELTPAASRPYFGGSTDNNILQLAIGYNGPGRLDGNETGSIGFRGVGGAGPRGDFGGVGPRGGFGGGLGGSTQVSSALVKLLEQGVSRYKWVAATEGSTAAAPLELATGDAVMSIGGFNGTDPWPTMAVFKELVAKHEVHYYVGQGSESFGGGTGSSAIAQWVAAHFKKETGGGETVYDLTKPISGTSS